MKSAKWLASMAGATVLALAGTAAHALVIGFSPVSQGKATGEIASVDIVLSGLDAAQEIVSSFNLDISFTNSPPVTFVGGSYSDALGIAGFETLLGFDPIVAVGGLIEMENVSLLLDGDLDALQGDSVVLGTLQFKSNVAAQTTLTLTYPQPGITGHFPSPTANPNVLTPDTTTATIEWRGDAQVPLPGTLLLLAAPLAWLMRRRS